ncbi:uncharacterized protein LOC128221308 isoform X2 [Mya arenaria]|uniref:uncharacterized protein LOC128221308 isoform X2 n=1 Tax=Mya arenaria TaxID=6604 RepID=UPI0022E0F6F8|nr:uncharacterized protein LOC128221308 isoform X2 [Mya arenaria]
MTTRNFAAASVWPLTTDREIPHAGSTHGQAPHHSSRQCYSISHLPDLAKGILKTAEYKQLSGTVDSIRGRLDELGNAMMIDQASLKDSHKNIIAKIKSFRYKINKILDRLEKKTVEQLDGLVEDLEKTIKYDLESCLNMNDQLKTIMEKLQQTTGKHKDTKSYIWFRKCQNKLNEVKSRMQEIQKMPIELIRFDSDESILPFLSNLNNFGNVDNGHSVPVRSAAHMYKALGSTNYSVRMEEEKTCCIVGICELPSGEVVIADQANNRVKLLNNQYQVTDHSDLPRYLHDLCLTADDVIAVAVDDRHYIYKYNKHEIHFLSVTRGKIATLRMFTTHMDCRSIAHNQGQLYISSGNALKKFTVGGIPVKTIYEDMSCKGTVVKCAVSPDGKVIYVTNNTKRELITLNEFGQVLFKFKDPELQRLSGLCVSPSGLMFVCGRKSNTVLQMDRDGRLKLATVARKAYGLCVPWSVYFSEQTSSLIIGNYRQDQIIVVKLC